MNAEDHVACTVNFGWCLMGCAAVQEIVQCCICGLGAGVDFCCWVIESMHCCFICASGWVQEFSCDLLEPFLLKWVWCEVRVNIEVVMVVGVGIVEGLF